MIERSIHKILKLIEKYPNYIAFIGFLLIASVVTVRGWVTGDYFSATDIVFANSPYLIDGGAHNPIMLDYSTVYVSSYYNFFENLSQGNILEYRGDIALGFSWVFFYIGRFIWSLPLLLTTTVLGINISITLMLIFTGFFMYLFVKKLSGSQLAGFLAGIAWMLSSHQIAWLQFPMHIAANLYIPLLLLFSYELLKKFSWKNVLWLGLTTFLFVTTDYMQLVVYIFIMIGLWNLIMVLLRVNEKRTLKFPLKEYIRMFSPILVLGSVALISAPYILAYLDTVDQGLRGAQSGLREVGQCIICSPRDLVGYTLGFISPDILGNTFEIRYFGPGNIVEYSRFSGLLTIFSLVLLPFIKDKFVRWTVFAIASVGLIFFFIMHGVPPFSTIFNMIPYLSFGTSFRMIGVVSVSLIVAGFTAFGSAKIDLQMLKRSSIKYLTVLLVLFSIFLLSIFLFPSFIPDELINRSELLRLYMTDYRVLLNRLILFFSLTSLIFVLYIYGKAHLFKKYGKIFTSVVILILLMIFIGDLGRFSFFFNGFTPKELNYPAFEGQEILREDDQYYRIHVKRDSIDFFPSNVLSKYGYEEITGYDTVIDSDYIEFYQNGFSSSGLKPNGIMWGEDNYVPMLEVLNTKYVFTRDEDVADPNLDKVFEGSEYDIYKLNSYKERFYSVQQVSIEKFEGQYDTLLDTVYLTQLDTDPDISTEIDEISDIEIYTESAMVRTSDNDGGYLVFSQVFNENWKAYIDGEEIQIYTANDVLMAVEVPEGEHQIEFVFRNTNYVYSSLAIGSLFILVAGAVLFKWYKTKDKELLFLGSTFLLIGLLLLCWYILNQPVDVLSLRQ